MNGVANKPAHSSITIRCVLELFVWTRPRVSEVMGAPTPTSRLRVGSVVAKIPPPVRPVPQQGHPRTLTARPSRHDVGSGF